MWNVGKYIKLYMHIFPVCFLGLPCALTIKIKSISEKLHALSNVHEAICSPCPRHIVKLNSSDVAQPVFQAFFTSSLSRSAHRRDLHFLSEL